MHENASGLVLEGQACMVAGGAGGIGAAVVTGFLKAGASVLALDRAPDRIAALEESLGGHVATGRLVTAALDATSWTENLRALELTRQHFGKLDVLTSCIGAFDGARRLADIDGEQIVQAATETFTVNVTSLLLAARACSEELTTNRGRIVATGSFASTEPSGGGALYTAAKHALIGAVRQLAWELAPHVRVNAVAPGVADTTITGLDALGQRPAAAVLEGTADALPLRRVPFAADYVAIYTLLASASQSAAMTGSVIVADSGLSVRGLVRA